MRHPIAAAALIASLALVPPSAAAQNMQVSVRGGHDARTCDDLEVTFDGRPAVTAVDRLTAPGGQKLSINPSRNGGVYVFGGARTDFAISVCKAAAPARGGGGALEQVRASLSGGSLTASGPAADGWIVYFIIDAPSQAALDLGGRVSARTQNGPIAFEGGGGTIDLEAQNGPVAVRLAGSKWAGGSLTAKAQNGPVKLDVPRGFGSGVRVQSSQHSPWKCQGCEDGQRTWNDDSRSVVLGSGPVAVTVSTVNGPVAVDMTR
jgi:hypothetical protein